MATAAGSAGVAPGAAVGQRGGGGVRGGSGGLDGGTYPGTSCWTTSGATGTIFTMTELGTGGASVWSLKLRDSDTLRTPMSVRLPRLTLHAPAIELASANQA